MHACRAQEHWFALRKVSGDWWDLNSLARGPKPLSEFYLSAYLATLRGQGYSIFLVRGALPGPFSDPVAAQEAPGSWFTPQQVPGSCHPCHLCAEK
jgi:ataxin-3